MAVLLCVCVCLFLRKPLYSSPYLKHISWTDLRSLNNKAPTENIYLLLELQYAISVCARQGRESCLETTLGYFPYCNVFSPANSLRKEKKMAVGNSRGLKIPIECNGPLLSTGADVKYICRASAQRRIGGVLCFCGWLEFSSPAAVEVSVWTLKHPVHHTTSLCVCVCASNLFCSFALSLSLLPEQLQNVPHVNRHEEKLEQKMMRTDDGLVQTEQSPECALNVIHTVYCIYYFLSWGFCTLYNDWGPRNTFGSHELSYVSAPCNFPAGLNNLVFETMN